MRQFSDFVGPVSRSKIKPKRPSMWTCVFFNDDSTPRSFIEDVLMAIFSQSLPSAQSIIAKMEEIGNFAVGVYPREIAELKVEQAITVARARQYPLLIVAKELPPV